MISFIEKNTDANIWLDLKFTISYLAEEVKSKDFNFGVFFAFWLGRFKM